MIMYNHNMSLNKWTGVYTNAVGTGMVIKAKAYINTSKSNIVFYTLKFEANW